MKQRKGCDKEQSGHSKTNSKFGVFGQQNDYSSGFCRVMVIQWETVDISSWKMQCLKIAKTLWNRLTPFFPHMFFYLSHIGMMYYGTVW
jgi:hypothetical protein